MEKSPWYHDYSRAKSPPIDILNIENWKNLPRVFHVGDLLALEHGTEEEREEKMAFVQ